jgi:hypothetical protein
MNYLDRAFNKSMLVAALGLACGVASAQSITAPQPGSSAPRSPQAFVSPQLNDIKSAIEKAEKNAEEAGQAAKAREQKVRDTVRDLRAKKDKTPAELAALKAARTELRAKEGAERSPEVRAARDKEMQARSAHQAAILAAKAAHAQADAAAQNADKIAKDLEAVRKPDPARGAHFTPQNVQPLLQSLDGWTKGLAGIKSPSDLAGPKLAQLEQGLGQLKAYMDRVDDAMVGVHRAGVQTPANKEAEALYMRAGDMAKALEAEMDRIEKLYPAPGPVHAIFAKFRD